MKLPNIAAYAYQDVHVWSALLTCLRPRRLDHTNREDGAKADSGLSHILQDDMADTINRVEVFCGRNTRADGEQLLSKASDALLRGMWWCELRKAVLSMVAGHYKTVRCGTDVQTWAQESVRG